MQAEHPERSAAALDQDRDAAAHPALAQHRRRGEALFGLEIGHHHRAAGEDRVAGVRVGASRHELVDADPGQSVGDAEGQRLAIELGHRGQLDVEQPGGGVDRLLHEIGRARALERLLPEPSDRRLLRAAKRELGLGLLLV